MPKGLKETSSIIMVGATTTETAPGTFTSSRVDLQLNPLDNEVFVVYSVDLDGKTPELIPATNTQCKLSVSTTARTSVGSIADSNVIAQLATVVQEAGGAAVLNAKMAGETPPAMLDYIGIIATNDFFVNIQGVNNVATMSGNVRLYGVRARADSSIYAALVQSELLSA
tara:strand:+ start:155 stop:661 length:507 start_codon:yes stop_codon:yes gene_type:complete